jgi:hypothetical protein
MEKELVMRRRIEITDINVKSFPDEGEIFFLDRAIDKYFEPKTAGRGAKKPFRIKLEKLAASAKGTSMYITVKKCPVRPGVYAVNQMYDGKNVLSVNKRRLIDGTEVWLISRN